MLHELSEVLPCKLLSILCSCNNLQNDILMAIIFAIFWNFLGQDLQKVKFEIEEY